MQALRWHVSVTDLFWAMLGLLGCLAMVGFEAISVRLFLGKW
jgi:hypothetical protein